MQQTLKQRSALVQAAERGLAPRPSRATSLLTAALVVGCLVLVAIDYWGAI